MARRRTGRARQAPSLSKISKARRATITRRVATSQLAHASPPFTSCVDSHALSLSDADASQMDMAVLQLVQRRRSSESSSSGVRGREWLVSETALREQAARAEATNSTP
jgi:hypothetical protein|eukprot:442348-Prymnesium_polylepis.1